MNVQRGVDSADRNFASMPLDELIKAADELPFDKPDLYPRVVQVVIYLTLNLRDRLVALGAEDAWNHGIEVGTRASRQPSVVDPLMHVVEERLRQIEVEAFSAERDDAYTDGELSMAAAAYAFVEGRGDCPACWPFPREAWKPTTTYRNLVKAGALILAELERRSRKGERP